jgi:hypothetical protein
LIAIFDIDSKGPNGNPGRPSGQGLDKVPFNLMFLMVVKKPISVMLDMAVPKEMRCDLEMDLS